MDKLAGCLPMSNASDSRKDWLSLLSRIPQTSNSLYAVHALKGSSVFYFTKRGDLDCCGTGCPQVVQLLSCFCRRGGWLPLAVSGRETCSKLEGRLPSVDPGQGTFADTGAGCPAVVSGSRSFRRHGSWLLSVVSGSRSSCRHGGRATLQ